MSHTGKPDSNLRSYLLELFQNSAWVEEGFVPLSSAIAGLHDEQATWKDNVSTHSIAEIVSHLIFWNEKLLHDFLKEEPGVFTGSNLDTFNVYRNDWKSCERKIHDVQHSWRLTIQHSTELQLFAWRSAIGSICAHNAYHTGQIMYIRKKNGWLKKV